MALSCADTDLRLAKGLDSVRHGGPSEISVSTLYKSGGNIPEAFLRGCGVPDELITYSHSLRNRAIDFYSCFIRYSSKNHDFAERLYVDLQSKGVRCWFAPEDLKLGDKFRQRIDESIRLHDKVLLILSEQSISSPWVEVEVESAIEREHKENRLVLFPVRIDDAVMDSSQAWAGSLRKMRHIGDFTCWKDHDSYHKGHERIKPNFKSASL
jgi:TIR domain